MQRDQQLAQDVGGGAAAFGAFGRRSGGASAAALSDLRRREQQMRKAELKAVQKDTSGADTLEAWKALKDEGKVLSSDDMSRDTDTNVLGSKDGLIAERIDENLPYIDQGYVAEDAGPDLSKALGDALGGLFGKKDDQR